MRSGKWMRNQLEQLVEGYKPLAALDMKSGDRYASGRGCGYEQCLGVIRAILKGVRFQDFRWDDKYDIVPRPIEYSSVPATHKDEPV